jgi:hypothetical protein
MRSEHVSSQSLEGKKLLAKGARVECGGRWLLDCGNGEQLLQRMVPSPKTELLRLRSNKLGPHGASPIAPRIRLFVIEVRHVAPEFLQIAHHGECDSSMMFDR